MDITSVIIFFVFCFFLNSPTLGNLLARLAEHEVERRISAQL